MIRHTQINYVDKMQTFWVLQVKKSKVRPCTGTEALYRPYGP